MMWACVCFDWQAWWFFLLIYGLCAGVWHVRTKCSCDFAWSLFHHSLTKWHKITHTCPFSICNHTEQSAESGAEAPWGAIWAISKQHLPQTRIERRKKKQLSTEELSSFWTHNCPPLPLQSHYSTIWLQGGKQKKRMKNSIRHRRGGRRSARISVDVKLDPPPPTQLLSVGVTLSKLGKAEVYENTVCVHSRWNCMSHPFGFHNVKHKFSSPVSEKW